MCVYSCHCQHGCEHVLPGLHQVSPGYILSDHILSTHTALHLVPQIPFCSTRFIFGQIPSCLFGSCSVYNVFQLARTDPTLSSRIKSCLVTTHLIWPDLYPVRPDSTLFCRDQSYTCILLPIQALSIGPASLILAAQTTCRVLSVQILSGHPRSQTANPCPVLTSHVGAVSKNLTLLSHPILSGSIPPSRQWHPLNLGIYVRVLIYKVPPVWTRRRLIIENKL